MKKIILIIITVTSTNYLYGQLDKKTWIFGGSGSFSSSISKVTFSSNVTPSRFDGDTEKLEIFNLNLSPSIGYFFFDKFAFGLKPTVRWNKTERFESSNGSIGGGTNSRDFIIGPFARYYFSKKEKPFNFLIESSYQLGILKELDNIKGNTNNLNMLVGTALYFNKTIALEFLLGYNRFFRTYNFESEGVEYYYSSHSRLQKGLQFSIGLQFHLEKK